VSHAGRAPELPDDKKTLHEKAIRLEWMTIAFFFTAVTAMYLAMGGSQAMKAAWAEDILAFVPPIAFLIASRKRYQKETEEYPYGYHRAVSIAFMTSAIALLFLGILIFYDSVMKLIAFEHPPVGLVQPWGEPIWSGWFMIVALAYTMFPAVILGRLKIPLARALHDKVLYADAQMNKADWMTAGAAILGVLGIYFGMWWADGVAAAFISLSIVKDGWTTLKAATGSLMDKRPYLVDDSAVDPLTARLATEMKKLSWVKDAKVRLREEGHVFYGDVIVIPSDERNLTAKIEKAERQMMELDWRLYDLTIMPRTSLEEPQEEGAREAKEGTVSR
jgi:cation diffusion facilitator family transporter